MKKSLMVVISSLLISCQSLPPINQSNINLPTNISQNISQTPKSGLKVKSFNEPIKKTILSPQRFNRDNGKPEIEIINFTVNKADLERKLLVNVINGPDGNTRISSAWIKVNGVLIIGPDKFDQDTPSTSATVKNPKEGVNVLEVTLASKPGSVIDVSIEGFMEPINIQGAVFSLLPDGLRETPYIKGLVGIKFLEGMKVRLIEGKLVDLNGISLIPLENLSELGLFWIKPNGIREVLPDLVLYH